MSERNEDGTVLPEHVTSEGRELVTPVEERIDHEGAKRIAEWAVRAFDDEVGVLARAYLALLTEHSALREALRRMVEHTPLDTLTYEQVRELGRAALPATEPAQPEEEP